MFSIQQSVARLVCVFLTVIIAACSEAGNTPDLGLEVSRQNKSVVLDVYKRPTCGCCKKWIEHLDENGFQTVTHSQDDFSALKEQKGIQPQHQSCHTAISTEGYVFEGHIPAKYIQQFLEEKPEGAIGLSVPAMPVGSPGMEVGDKFMPYRVLLLNADGSTKTYAQINTLKEQY